MCKPNLCPYCEAPMHPMDHGICPKCKRYCGCSFNPTNSNDFCKEHLPKGWRK